MMSIVQFYCLVSHNLLLLRHKAARNPVTGRLNLNDLICISIGLLLASFLEPSTFGLHFWFTLRGLFFCQSVWEAGVTGVIP